MWVCMLGGGTFKSVCEVVLAARLIGQCRALLVICGLSMNTLLISLLVNSHVGDTSCVTTSVACCDISHNNGNVAIQTAYVEAGG